MNDEIISVNGLVKRFGNFTAVDKATFSVAKGERFAFLGPNGAGKTTTIKILTTLLTRDAGKVSINNFDPHSERDHARASFGIVFQDHSLDDDLTAMENLVFHAALYKIPVNVAKKRINELLNLVELEDRKDDLVKTFSGGMKRRLEIIRALIHHPKILFLDEPTLGLDPQTRNHIWSYIKKLNVEEKMTVFFTTHYMQEAEDYAERVAIIDKGQIVAVGTPSSLKKQTKTKSLEQAFLKLTGHAIREENASSLDNLKRYARAWGRR